MSLVKSFFTVSSYTLVSRITGFIRDIFIAAIMGAGPLTEAFLVAFKLPNFFRRLFAEGAFNAAFVPMFSGKLARKGQEEALSFAETILALLFTTLLIFCTVMIVAMPWVLVVLAPGFVDDPEQFGLAVYLTRITFFYLLFISLVSLFAGVLNSFGKFAAVAATPILLNLCLIIFLVLLREHFTTPAHALAWGVAVAGVVQFFWLLLACKRAGVRLRLKRPEINKTVRKFLRKMLPGIVGAGIVQINLWVDIMIGTFIPGAIAYLYYADRVNQLPLSIIGTAMGTALLPLLSKQIQQKEGEKAIHTQNRALETVLFFAIPATMALLVVAHPIIATLFERGEFGADASRATAYGLMAYTIGLPAFVMVKIFTTGFFASGDTKTPVKIALLCMFVNIVLNITLVFGFKAMGILPHIGLALATSFASWLNITLLCRILHQRGLFAFDNRLRQRAVRIVLSACVMGAVLWGLYDGLAVIWEEGETQRITGLLVLVMGGMVSYFTSAYVLKAFDVHELKGMLKRKGKSTTP